MNIQNFVKQKFYNVHTTQPYSSTKNFQKAIQVCVLGGHTPLGRFTSFLLKQNPVLSLLRIQGDRGVDKMGSELSLIDTKCKVKTFEGNEGYADSMKSADIVLILGAQNLNEDTSIADRVLAEGKRVYDIAKECTMYSPRALIIVAVSPVSVFTPVVAEVFKQTDWYHPGRIVGSAALAQIKANTLLARNQGMDPQICAVPIVGGPGIDLAVPLFSRAKPVELTDRAAQPLLARFRGIRADEFPHKKASRENFREHAPMSEAFALNNMINCIGRGICGDDQAYYNCFARTNVLKTTCQHLVTTLQFSRGGVVHNYGLPQLTKLELDLLEKAALQIKDREQIAKNFIDFVEIGRDDPPPFKAREIARSKMLKQTVIRG
nr:unnamed protein product [Callosobruchus chinensis]